jgi:hypothetical protein
MTKRWLMTWVLCGWVFTTLSAKTLPDKSAYKQEVQRLGSSESQERNEAKGRLAAWSDRFPRVSLMYLADIYADAEDVEILYQLEILLRKQADEVLFSVPSAFLGVNFEQVNFPDQDAQILISSVVPDTPADEAGLRPGDVILEIQGRKISEISETSNFAEFIQTHLPLQIINLRMKRAAKVWDIDLKLGLRPPIQNMPNLINITETDEVGDWLKSLKKDSTPSSEEPVGHFRFKP